MVGAFFSLLVTSPSLNNVVRWTVMWGRSGFLLIGSLMRLSVDRLVSNSWSASSTTLDNAYLGTVDRW